MTYEKAVEFLEALTDFERLGFHRHFAQTVGLESARELLRRLGDPHRAVPCIHIAGTKGKGSTAAMAERILRQAGYKTGLFTSPHLVSVRERVRVDGAPIAPEALTRCVERVKPVHEQLRQASELNPCSFFEVYMALAALHFADEDVDLAIYEAGLGGRLDATNLVSPLVAAVTTIGLDHTYILGETLDAIAREKAEIAKPGVPLVVARHQPASAMAAIEQTARKNGAPLCLGLPVLRAEPQKATVDESGNVVRPLDLFEVGGPDDGAPPRVRSALLGEHQATNIGVVLAVLEQFSRQGYTVGEADIQAGLADVNWPGRLDIRGARPWLILDCAHNPESARALARALPEYVECDRLVLVIGMSDDKDVPGFARELARLHAETILTQARIDRALPADQLKQRAQGAWNQARTAVDVPEACREAVALAGTRGAVCVTGSFYAVGEAMTALGIEP